MKCAISMVVGRKDNSLQGLERGADLKTQPSIPSKRVSIGNLLQML